MDATPQPQQPTERLDALERKIEAIYVSVEKTRKYILVSTILTFLFFVLPLIGALAAVPFILQAFSSYSSMLQL